MLSYSSCRELFFVLYGKLLATRLLSSVPINKECEERMIANIRAEHGSNYSGPLERMVHDMELSDDLSVSFLRRDKRARTNCNYMVLFFEVTV